jgi:hypothetical protein
MYNYDQVQRATQKRFFRDIASIQKEITQLVDSPKASPVAKSILASDPRGKPQEPPRNEYSVELARIQRSLFPD